MQPREIRVIEDRRHDGTMLEALVREHLPGTELRFAADSDAAFAVAPTYDPEAGKGIAPEHLDRIFDPFFTGATQPFSGEDLALTLHRLLQSQGTPQVRSSS